MVTPTATSQENSESARDEQLTCFVVTGFGEKTDYSTGRVLNLDRTFEQLIQPACDDANVNAFRAIDANVTGSIDEVMYRWIYEADIVIADLSTLNANVFYELGVRHAQRPNTTIIIAESVLLERIPFDLNSFVIHPYDHGGKEISGAAQDRFVPHLTEILKKIAELDTRRITESSPLARGPDSPVYTFLDDMVPPRFTPRTFLSPPRYVPPEARKTHKLDQETSLADAIAVAEAAKEAKNFDEAIRLFERTIEMQTQGDLTRKPDLFLALRLALVTYKAGESLDDDGKKEALFKAEDILARYCAPQLSNDPETLGLSGAINKRLFEVTRQLEYLDKAIRFYERGFYVKQDYYNGINVSYMYTQRANLLEDRFDAIVSFGHANAIRERVAEICTAIVDSPDFPERGDRGWVYATLAEACQGLGRTDEETRYVERVEREGSDFAKSSYFAQRKKLAAAIKEFNQKVRPEELGAASDPSNAQTVRNPDPSKSARRSTDMSDEIASRAITVNADLDPSRAIKSINVHCTIEYS